MNHEKLEEFLNAYAIERAGNEFVLMLFLQKSHAIEYVEKIYGIRWAKIRSLHQLKIVKVIIKKEDW